MRPILVLITIVLASCVSTYRLEPLSRPPVEPQGLLIDSWAELGKKEVQLSLRFVNNSPKPIFIDSARFRAFEGHPGKWYDVTLFPAEAYYQAVVKEESRKTAYRRSEVIAPGSPAGDLVVGPDGFIAVASPDEIRVRSGGWFPAPDEDRLRWLDTHLVRSFTLQPGEEFRGVLFGARPRSDQYKVRMTIENADYEVVFERVAVKKRGTFTNLD